jgi:hypothetical protein
VWAGLVIAFLVPVLVCRVVGGVLRLIGARRRTRMTFRRSLLKAGLTQQEADSLTIRYNPKVPLRDLLRLRGRSEN